MTVNQTYTHYLPCGAQAGKAETERKRVAAHRALGYRITTYFNPHVCTTYRRVYDPAAREGLLVRNLSGSPYLLTNPFTADQIVSEIDFTRPAARDLFGRLLDEAIDAGYDGWMEDFGEYTPPDAVFSDGRNGAEMHNRYPVLYHRTSTEHTAAPGRRLRGLHPVRAITASSRTRAPSGAATRPRTGAAPTGSARPCTRRCRSASPASPTGAPTSAASTRSSNPRTTDELNTRWLQFGAVSGIMRTQSNGYSFVSPKSRRSQVTSPKVLPFWRRYTKLRTQLYPYIQAASRTYRRNGHAADAPARARLSRRRSGGASQTEFLFGPDLLAAPVVQPGARTRSLYVPRGRWIDLWRSVGYDERSGGLRLGRAAVARRRPRGPAARAARRAAAARTRGRPDPAPAARRRHARRPRRGGPVRPAAPAALPPVVLAFPRGSTRADLGTGATARSTEGRRRWRLTCARGGAATPSMCVLRCSRSAVRSCRAA